MGLGDEPDVIATHGIPLGGDHIDQMLFEQLLFPLLGKGESWQRAGVHRNIETLFPFERYESHLLNWSRSYLLIKGRYQGPILDQIATGGKRGIKFQRLHDLILLNQSFEVFQAIRATKEALSSETTGLLDLPQIDVELEVTRDWFDVLLAPFLKRIEEAVDETLHGAGLRDQDIDVVLCTGGSSLIHGVQELLGRRFKNIENYDPFGSVARGLAMQVIDSRLSSKRSDERWVVIERISDTLWR